jgi:hypothetical protein
MKTKFLLLFICALFFSCETEEKIEVDKNGNPVGACLLDKITYEDGSYTSYKYNSNNKWEKIIVSAGANLATFNLVYDATIPNGPVVSISGGVPGKSSISILDYNKDNLLINSTTRIDKRDMGIILGFPATATNIKTELIFTYNSDKLVTKISNTTTMDLTFNNKTNKYDFNSYETYEYNSNGSLKKSNSYSDMEEKLLDKTILKTDFVGYTTYDYGSVPSKLFQNLGLTNLAMDIADDGQLFFIPNKSDRPASKVTLYLSNENGGFDPYVSDFTHKNNSENFLSETIDLSDNTSLKYSYTNCK